jgi:hypothetical protein
LGWFGYLQRFRFGRVVAAKYQPKQESDGDKQGDRCAKNDPSALIGPTLIFFYMIFHRSFLFKPIRLTRTNIS